MKLRIVQAWTPRRLIDSSSWGSSIPTRTTDFDEAAVRKLGLVASFLATGIPADAIAAEIRAGHFDLAFLDNPTFVSFTALTDVTFEELAQERDIPVEVLLAIRESIGSAVAKPTDRCSRRSSSGSCRASRRQLASGYTPDAVERLVRILGDSLRRYVLAGAEAFPELRHRAARARPPDQEISAAAEAASERMTGSIEEALVGMYRAQLGNAWTANIVQSVTSYLAASGIVASTGEAPRDVLPGHHRLHPADRASVATRPRRTLPTSLGRLVTRVSVEHGGRPVKWLGDGVMFHFRDPGPGVIAALTMAAEVPRAGLPPAHVGLHAGPVVFQDGDYYGSTVNLASRIADYARPGEVLVSRRRSSRRRLTARSPTTALGQIELKGAPGPMELFVARRRSG